MSALEQSRRRPTRDRPRYPAADRRTANEGSEYVTFPLCEIRLCTGRLLAFGGDPIKSVWLVAQSQRALTTLPPTRPDHAPQDNPLTQKRVHPRPSGRPFRQSCFDPTDVRESPKPADDRRGLPRRSFVAVAAALADRAVLALADCPVLASVASATTPNGDDLLQRPWA